MDVITIVLTLLVAIIVLAWMDMYWKQTIALVKVKSIIRLTEVLAT